MAIILQIPIQLSADLDKRKTRTKKTVCKLGIYDKIEQLTSYRSGTGKRKKNEVIKIFIICKFEKLRQLFFIVNYRHNSSNFFWFFFLSRLCSSFSTQSWKALKSPAPSFFYRFRLAQICIPFEMYIRLHGEHEYASPVSSLLHSFLFLSVRTDKSKQSSLFRHTILFFSPLNN